MHRNLDRRVEALVRVSAADGESILEVIDLGMSDKTASWHLQPSGEWIRHHEDENGEPLINYQELLINRHPVARSAADAPTPRRIETLLNKVGLFGSH
jgi:polyphosphate kinase